MWTVVPDPDGIEYIVSPDLQLSNADNRWGRLTGDCDDSATLAAALCTANSYLCWFVAIRLSGNTEFSHVWLRVPTPIGYLDIDPIVPASELPIRGYAEKMELVV